MKFFFSLLNDFKSLKIYILYCKDYVIFGENRKKCFFLMENNML